MCPVFERLIGADDLGKASHVGHLRFTFSGPRLYSILIEATRPSVVTSTPTNVTFPNGKVTVTSNNHVDIHGYTDERQDGIITPTSIARHAEQFKGYFWARISSQSRGGGAAAAARVAEYGIVNNLTVNSGLREGDGLLLSAYVLFSPAGGEGEEETVIDVRVGTSLISESAARSHIEAETPQASSLEDTARVVRERWVEKLDRIVVEGASEPQKEVFYTAVFHSLTVSAQVSVASPCHGKRSRSTPMIRLRMECTGVDTTGGFTKPQSLTLATPSG